MNLLLSLLLTTPSHAGKRRDSPVVVADALEFATVDRAKAIALLEENIETHPRHRHLDMITLHAGEHRRLNGDLEAARAWFEQSLEAEDDGDWSDAARLGILLAGADDGLDAKGLSDLERISDKSALATQNADRHLLLAVYATQAQSAGDVNRHSKKALGYAKSDPSVYTRVKATLEQLTREEDPEVVEEGTLIERARKALEKGDGPRAAELARKAQAELDPESFEHLVATYMIRRAEANTVVNPDRIAVLLPMSDKYEAVGRQIQQAFEFGYREGGGTRNLTFVDTGGTPEGAVAALEQAVLQDGAVGVVGPLLSEAADAVVEAAAALEVPLMSLAQSNEEDGFDWVFQGVPSIGDQADALVAHVMGPKGMTAFAIFAPDNAYGQRAATEFREAVEARSGTITVETFYDPAAPALMEFAEKLGRKDYENRRWELRKIKEDIKEKGGNPDNAVLPPEIDFDAIFLPDNARKIPIACAALAYEEFPIGEFKPRRKQDTVPVLGLSGWNNADLVARGGEYVRGAMFTDAFFIEDSSGFAGLYKTEMGRSPSTLEAVTVDAARVLGVATREPIASRDDLRNALLNASVQGTPTGATGFDPERRRMQSRIRILSIDRESIIAVDVPEGEPE